MSRATLASRRLHLGLVAADSGGVEFQPGEGDEDGPGMRGRVAVLGDELAAGGGVFDHAVDVEAEVGGFAGVQKRLSLPELSGDAVAIPALDVDESAGEENEGVVELAARASPGGLEGFVTVPELSPVEEVEELVVGGLDVGGRLVHGASNVWWE